MPSAGLASVRSGKWKASSPTRDNIGSVVNAVPLIAQDESQTHRIYHHHGRGAAGADYSAAQAQLAVTSSGLSGSFLKILYEMPVINHLVVFIGHRTNQFIKRSQNIVTSRNLSSSPAAGSAAKSFGVTESGTAYESFRVTWRNIQRYTRVTNTLIARYTPLRGYVLSCHAKISEACSPRRA